MKNIVIFGSSGHCKVIIDIIEKLNRYNLVGIIDKYKKKVNGAIRLKLYKGNIVIQSRITKSKAYSEKKVSFEENKTFNKANIEKFIRFHSKQLKK